MTKTYELPKKGCLGSRRVVAEFDENGVGKITIQALDSLISELNEYAEQRQTGRWIPTSERLPEKDGQYLVTTTQGYIARYVFNKNGNSLEYWRRCVIAWMPLPKPYKGEREDEK